MNDRYRFLSTVAIWVTFMVLMLTLLIVLFLSGYTGQIPSPIQKPEQQSRKTKQYDGHSPIERLVESLDDDEIVELETLLLAQRDDFFGQDEQL